MLMTKNRDFFLDATFNSPMKDESCKVIALFFLHPYFCDSAKN